LFIQLWRNELPIPDGAVNGDGDPAQLINQLPKASEVDPRIEVDI